MAERAWWKESVVYQIYPRSFYDSNGDGIGDLRGIIEKLDYIKSLGVDVIWLNPVYMSPNDDNGYDISDYYQIMTEFGTMSDWEELLEGMHRRGLRMLMDLVVNHTSDEHEWFVKSRKEPDGAYRDYYIWKDGVDGREPNDWESIFSGSAWEYDEFSGQYYLHIFSRKQPDLNWENKAVRSEVYRMMKWWLDKGIDGFRIDTVNMFSKVQTFPNVGEKFDGKFRYAGPLFINGPRIHEFLREMHDQVFEGRDVMTVGECPDVDTELGIKYTSPESKELDMLFQFEHMRVDYGPGGKWDLVPLDLRKLKEVFSRWQTELHGKGWNSNYFMNHDQPRAVSRFGNDAEFRTESAKLLLACLLTLEGTPFIYQGEEIGMTNAGFTDISEYRDVEIRNHYAEAVAGGLDREFVLRAYRERSRDNSRTPMQWSGSLPNAGFTDGKPWINPAHNWREINVESDMAAENSIIAFMRRMIDLRKRTPALIYGSYELLLPEDRNLYAYFRRLDESCFLVVHNFSNKERKLPSKLFVADGVHASADILITNYADLFQNDDFVIRPWESRVYQIS